MNVAASLLQSIDSFGVPMVSFSLKGQDTFKTALGGLTTLFNLGVIIYFTVTRFINLSEPANSSALYQVEQGLDRLSTGL